MHTSINHGVLLRRIAALGGASGPVAEDGIFDDLPATIGSNPPSAGEPGDWSRLLEDLEAEGLIRLDGTPSDGGRSWGLTDAGRERLADLERQPGEGQPPT